MRLDVIAALLVAVSKRRVERINPLLFGPKQTSIVSKATPYTHPCTVLISILSRNLAPPQIP